MVNKSATRARLIASGLFLLAGIVACGGGSSPDPLQKYREQTVEWTECDSTILGQFSSDVESLTSDGRLRCALVRAPLDWSNPERGDIFVSAMRLAAPSESRRGSVVFNPGGPGTDGLGMTFVLLRAFADSNPDNPQGAKQLRLLNEYDMVGFSPRGTGASTRLQCATNELERSIDFSAAGWDAPENLANVHYNGSKTAEACLKNPITPYINSDATARDMDLLRGLLGDDKLHYVGYSYGTWLGAWYASLFPERVGRMVLDSALDFDDTIEKSLLHSQPPARQRLFDDVLVPYAVRHPDYFHLGRSEAEVRSVIPSLSARTQAVLAEELSGLGYERLRANQYLATLSMAAGLDAALMQVEDPADEGAMENALKQVVFDPSNPERDALLRNSAEGLYAAYARKWLNPQPVSFNLSGDSATTTAVRCNDTPAITDLTQWSAAVRELASQAPMYFGGPLMLHACAFWGLSPVVKPDWSPMKSIDVLFVQSQYDSATNTDHANRFFAQLPAARRVYVEGDYQHGVYPYMDSCVDTHVTDYLLGDITPSERESICAGKPLAQDAPPPAPDSDSDAQASKAAKADAPASDPSSVYKDQKKAEELINEFKQGLIPRERRRGSFD